MTKNSMQGWELKEWVYYNKGNLRLILSGGLGLLTAFVVGVSAPWAVALGGLVTTLSKLALDSFDYYLKE